MKKPHTDNNFLKQFLGLKNFMTIMLTTVDSFHPKLMEVLSGST